MVYLNDTFPSNNSHNHVSPKTDTSPKKRCWRFKYWVIMRDIDNVKQNYISDC